MQKGFTKGVTIGENSTETEKENTQQEIGEYETNEEESRALIRANEDDFIHGLLNAAEYATEETQRIEIIRGNKLYFAFNIRPLSAEEYDRCRQKNTKYVRNKQFGIKVPENTNRVKYQSQVIYTATVAEDREKLWDNRKVWDALNAQKDRVINGLDVIEITLKAGEKDKILEAIDKLSGYDDELEEIAKN
jgi:Phage XkdN-like protein.